MVQPMQWTRLVAVVEDSPEDRAVIERALQRIDIAHEVVYFDNGDTALSVLLHDSQTGRPLPSVIILDLNLPGADGYEILQCLRRDDRLAVTPVVVFTTASSEAEIAKAYAHRPNSFIRKPTDTEQFIATVEAVAENWLRLAELPQQ